MSVEERLSTADFDYVRAFAKESAAIVIDSEKRYLVESRLSPVAEQEGFRSLQALIQALRRAEQLSALRARAIDALTTHETSFFRDRHPFDALRDTILPELINARQSCKRLSIWSAAASTGQEAYSLAMLMKEHFPELESWQISILGTDISEAALERARAGTYGPHEVTRGLPAPLLSRYFIPSAERWIVSPELSKMVHFQHLNLMSAWSHLPAFDLILMRNVLIYFDIETKRSILRKTASQLAPDGYLVMGSAETPTLITELFQPLPLGHAAFYRKA